MAHLAPLQKEGTSISKGGWTRWLCISRLPPAHGNLTIGAIVHVCLCVCVCVCLCTFDEYCGGGGRAGV